MEIRAQSVHNEKTIKKYAKVTLKQYQLPIFITIDILSFLLVLLSTRSIIPSLIFLIIMTVYIVLIYVFSVKALYKAQGKFKETVNYFLFRDNDFTCSSRTIDGGYQDRTVISYSFPVKAIETNEYLYIYIQKNRAYIIDKKTIENGTIDNIRCKLMPILGNKYKIIK
ncbi:MAG: YcxB family protein [Eubacterium sp.]